MGNVLIIEEDNKHTLIPDDIGDGIIIMFDFEKVAEYMYEIGLLDMDYKTLITVMYQTTNGIMATKRRSVPILVDNSYQVLPINTAKIMLTLMVRCSLII